MKSFLRGVAYTVLVGLLLSSFYRLVLFFIKEENRAESGVNAVLGIVIGISVFVILNKIADKQSK